MRRTRTQDDRTASQDATVMDLDQLERMLSAAPASVPNSAVVRETARILQVASGGGTYATIVGERCEDGVRIVDGRAALDVARVVRARASWRGDHFWALELGRRLQFRVVIRDASPQRSRRAARGGARRAAAWGAKRLVAA